MESLRLKMHGLTIKKSLTVLALIIIMLFLTACNNDANEQTPTSPNVNDSINNGNNGTNGGMDVHQNGNINDPTTQDGATNGQPNNSGVNGNGGANGVNEGTPNNNGTFKDEAEEIIDETEDAIRGEDHNNKNDG